MYLKKAPRPPRNTNPIMNINVNIFQFWTKIYSAAQFLALNINFFLNIVVDISKSGEKQQQT